MAQALTEAQEGLWFFQRLDASNSILNTSQYLEITGELDVERFQAAVRQAIDEAEALRLVFKPTETGAVQQLGAKPAAEFCDLRGAENPETTALGLMRQDTQTPCDLAQGLAKFVLYVIGNNRYFWYQRIHHLAIDGYGFVLLTNRVAQIYTAIDAGAPLAPLAKAFEADADYRVSARREIDRQFWIKNLAELPEIKSLSVFSHQTNASSSSHFLRVRQEVAGDLLLGLQALAARAEVSWPDALTALVSAYCHRFTGGEEAVVGVPFMGRLGSKAARVPAMVMNVLPLRVAPDETEPLTDWLAKMAVKQAEARRHGRYRSELLRRELGRIGGTRRLYGPLINVQPFDVAPKIPELSADLHILGAGAVDDITFTFRGDARASLSFETDANPALYTEADVQAHSDRLMAFLAAAVDAHTLREVPTISGSEAKALAAARRTTLHSLPETSLTALIERQFKVAPAATALRFDDKSMSYAELDQRSAELAGVLQARGAGPDKLVAVALERSFALVVALVAILRSGAAYLPLDISHPDERLNRILERAKPVAVLCSTDLTSRFPQAVALKSDGAQPLESAFSAPVIGPDTLAYVIFTSGSTGEPKGVMIDHRAIVNRLIWMQDHYGFTSEDRILQKTPATFDVSVWEFFLPLIRGATLVIAAPGAHRDPSALARLIRAEDVTTMHFVPSMLSAFLAAPASEGIKVRRVFCSGEELTADQRDRFHRRIRGELHNLYGPTEAAVDVSYWPASPEDQSSPLPIGFPVWNTTLEILDQHLREVPDGVAGQLYLGGVQLARGYLGQPELTAERFIADPHQPGGRLYATGDLARRRPDGAVIYLGRNDHQVKIRGLRIELGEIEAALMSFGGLREAVVMARDGRLVAYTVPKVSDVVLRGHLARLLPDYMVPFAILGLDALPVTSNGKLDRKALPEPAFEHVGSRPLTPVETRLASIFAEVLGLSSPPGAEADFFALGGDSLSAVRLTYMIEEVFGTDPGLGTIFERPVLSALAEALGRGPADQGLGASILLASAPQPSHALPLALIHPAGGLGWGYRGLASALPGRDVYALQAPMLDPGAPMPRRLEDLAKSYADLLEKLAPGRAWHICGWSVGGIIAQSVAAELASRGHAIGLVALLDSYPADVWRDEPEADEVTALRALLAVAGFDPEAHPELQDRGSILEFLKYSGSALGNLPEAALEGVIRTVAGLNLLVRGHETSHYPGLITHICAALDHHGTALRPDLWSPFAASIDTVPVQFRHPELTSPDAVAVIAPVLAARMAAIEREET